MGKCRALMLAETGEVSKQPDGRQPHQPYREADML